MRVTWLLAPALALSCGTKDEDKVDLQQEESLGRWAFVLPSSESAFGSEYLISGELRKDGYVFTMNSDDGKALSLRTTARVMPECPDFGGYAGIVMATGVLDLQDLVESKYFLVQSFTVDGPSVSFHARVKDNEGCFYLSFVSLDLFDTNTGFNRGNSPMLKNFLSIANTIIRKE